MSKNKWKAYFITVAVLFVIVRTVQSCRQNNKKVSSVGNEKLETESDVSDLREPSKPQKIKLKASSISINKPAIKKNVKALKPLKKGNILKNKNPYKAQNPSVFFKIDHGLALSGGDMILGQIENPDKNIDYENTVFQKEIEKSKLWPSPNIPFGFSENIEKSLKEEVLKAIKYLNEKTNLNLTPINSDYDEDAIVFDKKEGAPCSSYVGRLGGYQPIFINSSKCKQQGIMHEILHAIGFVHEQQRVDRDNKIEILWDNIKEGNDHNFSILPDELLHPYSGSVFDIDFKSIMIYPENAFAKKGLKSMRSKLSEKISPTNVGLSDIDIERINYLYSY